MCKSFNLRGVSQSLWGKKTELDLDFFFFFFVWLIFPLSWLTIEAFFFLLEIKMESDAERLSYIPSFAHPFQ